MNAGVFLKQGFSATGFNEDVRFDPDFFSRLYFIEESAL
jgi:alpha-galactosidase